MFWVLLKALVRRLQRFFIRLSSNAFQLTHNEWRKFLLRVSHEAPRAQQLLLYVTRKLKYFAQLQYWVYLFQTHSDAVIKAKASDQRFAYEATLNKTWLCGALMQNFSKNALSNSLAMQFILIRFRWRIDWNVTFAYILFIATRRSIRTARKRRENGLRVKLGLSTETNFSRFFLYWPVITV